MALHAPVGVLPRLPPLPGCSSTGSAIGRRRCSRGAEAAWLVASEPPPPGSRRREQDPRQTGFRAIRLKVVIEAETSEAEPQAIGERAIRFSPVANSLRQALAILVHSDSC